MNAHDCLVGAFLTVFEDDSRLHSRECPRIHTGVHAINPPPESQKKTSDKHQATRTVHIGFNTRLQLFSRLCHLLHFLDPTSMHRRARPSRLRDQCQRHGRRRTISKNSLTRDFIQSRRKLSTKQCWKRLRITVKDLQSSTRQCSHEQPVKVTCSNLFRNCDTVWPTAVHHERPTRLFPAKAKGLSP